MMTTTQRTGSGLPLTGGQQRLIDDLSARVLQTDGDHYEYNDRLKEHLGDDCFQIVEGYEAWAPQFVAKDDQERITRAAASACIEVLKAMDIPRCPGYCGERGVKHSMVRYYDDHYDYECGLS